MNPNKSLLGNWHISSILLQVFSLTSTAQGRQLIREQSNASNEVMIVGFTNASFPLLLLFGYSSFLGNCFTFFFFLLVF